MPDLDRRHFYGSARKCGRKDISHCEVKEDGVRTGRTNAAPVIDQDGAAQGWCPHSSPEEAPDIKHRRICDQDAPLIPDWRTTCFQVGRKRHGQ